MGKTRDLEILKSGRVTKDDSKMSVNEIMNDAQELYERTGKADPAFKKMVRDMVEDAKKDV